MTKVALAGLLAVRDGDGLGNAYLVIVNVNYNVVASVGHLDVCDLDAYTIVLSRAWS